jgi:tetratricopeptide (TPR) repeat protein
VRPLAGHPPLLGLALIAKDEQDALPCLLESIEGAFDQVVLVDTGSTDATVAVFRDWAAAEAERHSGFRWTLERFEWVDDFAAARNFADSLLETEWRVWADADDEIRGAGRLREIAARVPQQVSALRARYLRGFNETTGLALCHQKRERLVRAGRGVWRGRVHEVQAITGPVAEIAAHVAEWVHRSPLSEEPSERNLALLQAWVRDEPDNLQALRYLAAEHAVRGDHVSAVRWYRRYLEASPRWSSGRAQACRRLATSLLALNRAQEALTLAREALDAVPEWPDSYLTLAEAHLALGQPDLAIGWARRAIAHGVPETGLIIAPLDYTLKPRMILAAALRAHGRHEEARAAAEESLDAYEAY